MDTVWFRHFPPCDVILSITNTFEKRYFSVLAHESSLYMSKVFWNIFVSAFSETHKKCHRNQLYFRDCISKESPPQLKSAYSILL